jgi:hypothetical protein
MYLSNELEKLRKKVKFLLSSGSLLRKEQDTDPDQDPVPDPCSSVRIKVPDPLQNVMDPEHWFRTSSRLLI